MNFLVLWEKREFVLFPIDFQLNNLLSHPFILFFLIFLQNLQHFLQSMQIVVVEVHMTEDSQVTGLLQLSRGIRVATNELCPGLEAHALLQYFGKPEIQKNPLLKIWTPTYIGGLDVPVSHLQRMHGFHPLQQFFFEGWSWHFVGCLTELHREFDAIIVANDVISKHILETGTDFKDRGNFIKDELSDHFINFEVESSSILFLYFLRF